MQVQTAIRSPFLVRPLENDKRGLAVIRAKLLAVQIEIIFQNSKDFHGNEVFTSSPPGGLSIDYRLQVDMPGPGKLTIDV